MKGKGTDSNGRGDLHPTQMRKVRVDAADKGTEDREDGRRGG